MFMPVGGEIIEKNEEIDSAAELVNKDPYEKGWMIKIKMSNPDEIKTLLSAEQYMKLIGA